MPTVALAAIAPLEVVLGRKHLVSFSRQVIITCLEWEDFLFHELKIQVFQRTRTFRHAFFGQTHTQSSLVTTCF